MGGLNNGLIDRKKNKIYPCYQVFMLISKILKYKPVSIVIRHQYLVHEYADH